MIETVALAGRVTLVADRAYDTAAYVAALRVLGVTPHVARNDNRRRPAIGGRTKRLAGYAISRRLRKRIEDPFGWMKTAARFRKTRHRGRALVNWMFTLIAAAYNLIRQPQLLAARGILCPQAVGITRPSRLGWLSNLENAKLIRRKFLYSVTNFRSLLKRAYSQRRKREEFDLPWARQIGMT
jgi:Transposase DDE domain